MSYKTGEVSPTFTNQFAIHGLHCTIEEANDFLAKSDYPEVKAIEVEHMWATWGRLPEELAEYKGACGWWAIPDRSEYKHKKKMTVIVTEESKKIDAAIQKRRQERRERYNVGNKEQENGD